jgi:hypothetical protein
LAAWAAGLLGHAGVRSELESLLNDETHIRLYLDESMVETTVQDLARRGLECLDQ